MDLALAEIASKCKGETIQVGNSHILIDSIPTGILSLDVALGCGGLPKGRIVEIYGPESSGKTTLALQCVASCQKNGGVTAFIDAEHALDPKWAEQIGVDVNKLLINQPSSGEKAFYIINALAKHGACDLIVVDSVPALTPQAELDGDVEDVKIGAQARMMSKGLRMLVSINTKTCILFINQVREKIGTFIPFGGSNESTPGGRALKHNASVRMDIKRIGSIKVGDHSVGNAVRIKTAKNKLAPPFKECRTTIFFGSPHQKSYDECPAQIYGFDIAGSVLGGAIDTGVVSKRGSNYYFGERRIGNGESKTTAAIRDDDKLRMEIVESTMNFLRGNINSDQVQQDGIPEADIQSR